MIKVTTTIPRTFPLMQPVKIRLLVRLSDIEPDYLNYPEDNKRAGSIMDFTYMPTGQIYLGEMSTCFLGSGFDKDYELTEGIHFEFL